METERNMDMHWLEFENDDPLWVKTIHKNRFVGKPFKPNTIENMTRVALRPDDILIGSYAKSGCHWLWDNVRMLLAGEVKRDSGEKEEMMMEFHDHGHFDDFPSPRILNNHVFFDDQPADLLKGQTKVILIYRNPKDVCVSYFHHHSRIPAYKYHGKFSNYMHRFLQGRITNNSYFDYLKMWEEGLKNHPNIPYLLVRYEDLHKNPISERRRLATFLGREYEDSFLQGVMDATNIDTARQLKVDVSMKDNDGKPIMYRKGIVGDWKNHFTVSQSELFDSVTEKEMAGSKLFDFIYSID